MFGGSKQVIDSYLGWWDAAGYDLAASDERRDWLAGSVTTATRPQAPEQSQAAVAPQEQTIASPVPAITAGAASLPGTVSAFDTWWIEGEDAPGAIAGVSRIAPQGPVGAPLMIVTDCPDMDDIASGRLFAGKSGILLDAMLAAISLSRAEVRISALVACRPPGGMIDPATVDRLAQIARHQLSLVKPKCLLVIGQNAMRALKIDPQLSNQPQFNQDGANVEIRAIHHPRLLIERPLLKRQAWETLKLVRTFV